MPFTVKESIGGLQHLGRSIRLRLFKLPADHYLSLMNKKGLKAVPHTSFCHLCGSTIARVELTAGGNIDVCPAASLEDLTRRIICQSANPDHILHK